MWFGLNMWMSWSCDLISIFCLFFLLNRLTSEKIRRTKIDTLKKHFFFLFLFKNNDNRLANHINSKKVASYINYQAKWYCSVLTNEFRIFCALFDWWCFETYQSVRQLVTFYTGSFFFLLSDTFLRCDNFFLL